MPEPLQPGDPAALGRYRLVARLGRGGMGTVFLGQDEQGKRVAVKVINAELAGDPKFQDRFRREVAAARRVRRFCTAPVLDASLDAQPMYVVTEYIDGPTLEDVIVRNGPMQGSALEGLAVSMAVALSAIHDAGIVHRDLKPANVLLSGVGPKVIDFGIARALDMRSGLTGAGQIMGTPAYMAPELINGNPVSPASDVFSWGCVVAFAGTGEDPFRGNTLAEIIHRVAHEPPWLHGLDSELLDIVAQSLLKDPASRPTVPELLERLAGRTREDRMSMAASVVPPFGPGHGSTPRIPPRIGQPPTPAQPRPRSSQRPPEPDHGATVKVVGIVGTAIGLLVTTAVAVLLWWPDKHDPRATSAEQGTSVPTIGRTTPEPSRTGPTNSPTVNPGDIDRRFIGKWSGVINHQSSRSSTFPAVLTITGGNLTEVIGRSDYSTEGCGGSLRLVSASKSRIVVEERIDQGQGLCKKVVVITLTHQAGRLKYEYRLSNARGTGTLSK